MSGRKLLGPTTLHTHNIYTEQLGVNPFEKIKLLLDVNEMLQWFVKCVVIWCGLYSCSGRGSEAVVNLRIKKKIAELLSASQERHFFRESGGSGYRIWNMDRRAGDDPLQVVGVSGAVRGLRTTRGGRYWTGIGRNDSPLCWYTVSKTLNISSRA